MKYLNLGGNFKLSLKETLAKLQKNNALEQVFFGMAAPRDHKNYLGNQKYRIKVFQQLLFNNPNLRFLDNVWHYFQSICEVLSGIDLVG
jgi:ABC-type uncharacterized transport system YnjBCD ATPase subunit